MRLQGWLTGLLVLILANGTTGCASLNQPPTLERVRVRDLIATPAWFDGRIVAVSGQATGFRMQASPAQPAYSFRLDDGTQTIDVRAPGAVVACPPPRRVAVEGWFRAGRPDWFGWIEAITVDCR